MNLFDAIFPDDRLGRIAILFEQQRITYAELREQTIAVARVLSLLGVSRGDRVALLLNDSPEFIRAFIAICSYGAIAVPINMGLRADEQRAILNDCSASFAFIESDLAATLEGDAPDRLPHLRQAILVIREQSPAIKNITVKANTLDDLLSQASTASFSTFPEPEVDEPSSIFYTSGSTGEPKGAVHRQSDYFYTNETYCREVLQLKQGDRLFSSSRLPFSYGLGNAFTFPLFNGCTTILCREKPTPNVIERVFANHKPTIFFAVPVIYSLLLAAHKEGEVVLDVSKLRLCVSAGEALPSHLGEEWEKTFGVPVLDGIGSTEMLHMWMSNHEGEVAYGSSGKLLKGYQARLLDPDGAPTPPGTEGNLWVRGASAAIGYWEKPETTAATFVDGWLRTGDLYRCDSEGFWFHMGRSDDCFKSSGQWVSPVEVEGVLLRHNGVRNAAVVADFDEQHLPCACAFIVRAETSASDAALETELRELARANLPRFKQPRRYLFVDDLPYTATGKIQRFKLRKEVQSPMSNVQSLHAASEE